MKVNNLFTTIMLTIGIFLISNGAFACEMKVEKSCCKKETTSKVEKKSCCEDNQSNKKDQGCEGKCGHSNCTTSAPSISFIPNNDVIFTSNVFVFSSEKQKFYHNETTTSNGFFSLWLIPKIG